MRAGESMARVTPDGKIEAERSRTILLEEANKALADAESRTRARHRVHCAPITGASAAAPSAPQPRPISRPEDLAPNWRKPYAD